MTRFHPVQRPPTERLFAVVGGGRWARVYLSVMAGMAFPYRVVVVSSAQAAALEGLRPGGTGSFDFEIVPDLDALPQDGSLVGALVVNAAALHAATAARVLSLGAGVLVEKPAALRQAQQGPLLALAEASGLVYMPALTFLHCSYLERVAGLLQVQRPRRMQHIRLRWHDPLAEQRYGEAKAHDPGISIVQDVMPHVWAVLATTLDRRTPQIEVTGCEAQRGGRGVRLVLAVDGVPCDVDLQRGVAARHRHLAFEFSDGPALQLDFTQEPGTVTLGTYSASADPDWALTQRPVRRQLQAFLDALAGTPTAWPWPDVAAGCTALVEQADHALKQAQCALLRQSAWPHTSDDVVYAFCEVVGARLRDAGLAPAAGDRLAWTVHLEGLLRRLAAGPAFPDWYSAAQSLGLPAS